MRNDNVVDTVDYATLDRLEVRQRIHALFSEPPDDVEQSALTAAGPIRDSARVLDVGCGTGSFLEQLAKASASLDPLGADIADSAVTAVAARGLPAVRADVRKMPFADDSFDLCFARHLFQHIDEVGLAMSECRRVLKQNGRLVVVINHRAQAPLLSDLILSVVADHGIETRSIPSFDPLIILMAMKREFGNITTAHVHGHLVFRDERPLIAFAESLLSFYGVPAGAPQRPGVLVELSDRISRHFGSGEPWRDAKGYSASFSVK